MELVDAFEQTTLTGFNDLRRQWPCRNGFIQLHTKGGVDVIGEIPNDLPLDAPVGDSMSGRKHSPRFGLIVGLLCEQGEGDASQLTGEMTTAWILDSPRSR